MKDVVMPQFRDPCFVSRCGREWGIKTHEQPLTIGRSPCNDLPIEDPSVSRNHAAISCINGVYFAEDLGSRNGTFLNRIRLMERTRIRNGDCLQVGSFELVFQTGESTKIARSAESTEAQADDDSRSVFVPERISAELLAKLKAGDKAAADTLISACFERVARAARRRLNQRQLRGTGSEDIAASVFESLWKKIDLQQFTEDQLTTSDEFWRLLCTMVRFKAEDHARREMADKRGGGRVQGEGALLGNEEAELPGLAGQAGSGLSPAEQVMLRDQHEHMLRRLSDATLQEVVTLRLEGHSVREMAEHFGKSDRWVKRKLAEIRSIWSDRPDMD